MRIKSQESVGQNPLILFLFSFFWVGFCSFDLLLLKDQNKSLCTRMKWKGILAFWSMIMATTVNFSFSISALLSLSSLLYTYAYVVINVDMSISTKPAPEIKGYHEKYKIVEKKRKIIYTYS